MDTTRASLLLRIRDRADAVAWGEFDAIYRPLLFRFARASGLDATEADDLVQQCLAAIAEHIGRFDYDPVKGRFKGWLRTLVNNNVRKRLRGRRPQQAETRHFQAVEATEPTPEEVFDGLWLNEHLRFCLEAVRREVEPQTFRAFQLYVLEEQPVERVCAELNVSANLVYKAKWRITQKLDEKMRALTDGAD